MGLTTGTRLGPYEIVAPIGAGGMGEVYKARDTRLQRLVAIKVVPASIAGDADALARFEREAQAVAALSHPNILALHDIGRESGTGGDVTFAVMELLDGKTLREVLATGALPVRKAVEYGRQIADGLAAAHERGIVHRDLKPENLFVTNDGRVKLLDFGLALVTMSAPGLKVSTAETVLAQVDTTPGTILGTIGYMAPEQVRGQVVDSRADIFAFGAVLYEMIGGTRAFAGPTPADTMSAILNSDPGELSTVASGSHASLDRIVRRALEKEPAQRFQSARDLGFALEAIGSGSSATSASVHASPSTTRRRNVGPIAVALGVGLAVGLALGGGLWRALTPAAAEGISGVSRFTLPAAPFQVGLEWVSVSPDGRTLAYGGNISSATSQNLAVWTRRMENTSAEVIRGVEDVWRGMFLADNKTLLCVNQRQFFTIDLETGRRSVLWAAESTANVLLFPSFDVDRNNRIVVSRTSEVALLENGKLRVVAKPGPGERALLGPRWMPDGKNLLVSARMEDNSLTVFVMPVDGGTRRPVSLPQDITAPLITADGVLLYGQNGILRGQHLDLTTLALVGGPVQLAADLSMDSTTGFMGVSVSEAGVLALRSPAASQVQFEWVDRNGRPDRKVGTTNNFANFDVAPDGRVVTTRREPFLNGNSLWLIDPERQITAQIGAFEGQSFSDPAFSPDGSRMAVRKGPTIVVRTFQGGTETVLRNWTGFPDSWSRDNRYLTVGRPFGGDYQLWAVSLDDPSKDVAIVADTALADEGRFSPDGKWVAYHAAQKSTPDVFVTPFPPTKERLQISTMGGVQPRWSPDGHELYFLDLSGQLMSVEMPGGNPRQAKAPQPLFRTDLTASSAMDQFSVSANGKQFLLRRPLKGASNDAPVQVVLNWRALMTASGK